MTRLAVIVCTWNRADLLATTLASLAAMRPPAGIDLEFGQRCLARGEAVAYEPLLGITAPVEAAVLTRRYFRRWAFKAGISSSLAPSALTNASAR